MLLILILDARVCFNTTGEPPSIHNLPEYVQIQSEVEKYFLDYNRLP